ncbi:hypothetical protein LOK49_LG06G03502 [Camellia lanceoleosa]|uniref:Uncharacterized protein n=1 Tax=Camellia lanceoleosa TaxID=1840588 RepID=A0ACC0HA43_9ERIC|nr:hypothetical protein LOK49_LG06G03502 [Camellia lanceoleosa]
MFCAMGLKKITTIYFCCDFSAYIWTVLLRRIFPGRRLLTFAEEFSWAARNCGGKAITACDYRLTLAGTMYHVWKEGNYRIFKKLDLPVHVALDGPVGDIRAKLNSLRNVEFCPSG